MPDHTITLYTIYQEDDSGSRQSSIRGDVTITGTGREHSLHASIASGTVESSAYLETTQACDMSKLQALFLWANGNVTVSVNEVSTGSPDVSYSLTSDTYLIWHSGMLGVSNPWATGITDWTTPATSTNGRIYILNTSGSTVDVSFLALENV